VLGTVKLPGQSSMNAVEALLVMVGEIPTE
jgi:hypothetical protein